MGKFQEVKILGMISGIVCIVLGFILTILGFTGSISWIVEVGGFTSKLINASPGVFLMLLGYYLVRKERYKVKIKKNNDV